jgi:uncharacterized membrane protein YoaK (UPF0700 family)
MPLNYARELTGLTRSARANLHLGAGLAFVAGATNAGAFLAVQQYTSHMTGIVSTVADAVVLGQYALVLTGVGALGAFVAGAATTAISVNFSKRRGLGSVYAQPLLLEAVLLLAFGILGARLGQLHGAFVPLTVALLCYTMGLQNAVVTKISDAEVRTTHVTGIVTDLGIELGKLVYVNRHRSALQPRVEADRTRLLTLGALLGGFFVGGVLGALGFQRFGYLATVPLAAVLLLLTLVPVVDDLRRAGGPTDRGSAV